MRKIILILTLLFALFKYDTVFSINFDLYMKEELSENAKIYLTVDWADKLSSVSLFVWDQKLLNWSKTNNTYEFIFPKLFKINPLNKNIIIKYKLYSKEQEFYYDKFFPIFEWLNLLDLKW